MDIEKYSKTASPKAITKDQTLALISERLQCQPDTFSICQEIDKWRRTLEHYSDPRISSMSPHVPENYMELEFGYEAENAISSRMTEKNIDE